MRDGKLVAAAQEERFSRIKNDKAFPAAALRFCLDEAGLTVADLDHVAFYEDSSRKLGRQIWMGLLPGVSSERRAKVREKTLWTRPETEIRAITGYDGPIERVDHHLSHAASAYFYSGFEKAAILTVDGVGEWPTTTYSSAEGVHIRRIEQVEFPNSLGLFYSALTGYLGFEVNEGEYKVMGLAPYGNPTYVEHISRLIENLPGAQYQLNLRYFAFLQEDLMFSEALGELLGAPARSPESEITQFHMDVARSTQVVLENVLLSKVRYLYDQFPCDSLCMAGGVALNVVANSRCLREGPFERLFVQPAAGDAGGCLGAAAVAHVRHTGQRPSERRLQHVYFGPSNSLDDIFHVLRSSGMRFGDYRGDVPALIDNIVHKLMDGQVIAWVYGRMEFGPRALGARSILADPRRPEMKDRINALVKQREGFRPFAPAVLETVAHEHFALEHPSPFMLETCAVISPIPLPAITHVDGSARVQTVTHSTNPRLAALLQRFYDLTSCPVLLNTSFNLRGEPIVCTAVDAIACFTRSKMETLVLDDFVLERSDIPPLWERLSKTAPGRSAQGYAVYTML
jgi:carbamoyltransferase